MEKRLVIIFFLCCYSANIGRNENDLETWLEFLKLLKT